MRLGGGRARGGNFLTQRPSLSMVAAMRADSHTPPEDWDFTLSSWDYTNGRNAVSLSSVVRATWLKSVLDLKKLKADTSEAGKIKKAVKARADQHKKLHTGDQVEHEPPILEVDMDGVIVDPMHCLFLDTCRRLCGSILLRGSYSYDN